MIGASWINGHGHDSHPTYTTTPANPVTITHPVSIHAPSAGFAGAILPWGEAGRSAPSGARRPIAVRGEPRSGGEPSPSMIEIGGQSPPPSLSTKVGFDDTLIGLDHAGRALGDLLTVVEHEHRFAQAHDDLHVVFDEQD